MRSSRPNLSKPLSPIAIKPAAISANPAVTMIRVVINCVRQVRRKSKRYGQAIRHSNDDVADGFGACEVASDVGCLVFRLAHPAFYRSVVYFD